MTFGILRLTSIIMMDKVNQPNALVPILAHLHLAPAILAVLSLQTLNHVLIRDLPRYIAHDQIAIIRLLLIIRAMSFFVHLNQEIDLYLSVFLYSGHHARFCGTISKIIFKKIENNLQKNIFCYVVVICECVPIFESVLKPSFALCLSNKV